MIEAPQVPLSVVNDMIEKMSLEDRESLNQYRIVHLSLITQHFIEIMRKKDNSSFDEFIRKSVLHYGYYLAKKIKEESCQKKLKT